ncbi:ABC-2 type transport system ATP-binding protein [Virgibacillus campisalis]|uniref:ABC-2 type transport system ATP-binding protein n=1 Tax=Virgibacillus alimentarius TaxID=698769 RepID=A0ABS4S838_9BACI|nr:ABC-2 type transport system ATP-binding protein [Virgibacillus alimentarius]
MQALLAIDNLTGGYSRKNVLKGISFKGSKNEVVGLIGLNGAGI